MHRVLAAVVALCLLAPLGACSGDGDDGPLTPERFFWKLEEATCRWYDVCGANAGAWGFATAATADRCLAYHRLRLDLQQPLVDWIEAVDRGTVVWHPESAAECVERSRERPCDLDDAVGDLRDFAARAALHPACAAALEGLVDADGECWTHEECRHGWCDAAGGCEGRCRPFLLEGEPCGSAAVCGPGMFCDLLGRCLGLASVEQPGTAGERCGADGARCRGDHWCDTSAGEGHIGVCRPRAAPGEPCYDEFECRAGLVCVDATCRRPALVRAAGAPCDLDSICDPLEFLDCGADGDCVEVGRSEDRCVPYYVCRDGLTCSGTLCLTLRPDGAPCIDGIQCRSGGCREGLCGPPTTCP